MQHNNIKVKYSRHFHSQTDHHNITVIIRRYEDYIYIYRERERGSYIERERKGKK
jgi:hypothetical protein